MQYIRGLIRIAATTSSLLLLTETVNSSPTSGCEQPNILIVVSDDQAWTHFGFMRSLHDGNGNALEKPGEFLYQRNVAYRRFPAKIFLKDEFGTTTPHLDRLADAGIVFPFSYAGSSLCHPSFQTLLTSRLEPFFGKRLFSRLEGAYPYYMPELLESARLAAQSAGAEYLKRYRTLAYGKLWTHPERGSRGVFEAGFDCAWRPTKKAIKRLDIQPLLDFIGGDVTLRIGPTGNVSFDEAGPGVGSGLFECRHKTTCGSFGKNCKAATDETRSDYWATELTEGAEVRPFEDRNRPWLAWYSPWLPHVPTNARRLLHNAEMHYHLGTLPCRDKRGNARYPPECSIPVVPRTDNGGAYITKDSNGFVTSQSEMRSLQQRVETMTAAEVYDAAYLSTVMLLDYWVGQLLDFLSSETDLRCGKPMSETTLVVYQSDNGAHIPNSKSAASENGNRAPIIVHYPDRLSETRDGSLTVRGHMLHAVDIVPTMVDYSTTGLACFATCDTASGEGPRGPVTPLVGPACDLIAPPSRAKAEELGATGCLGGKSARPAIENAISPRAWRRWMYAVGPTARQKKEKGVQARRDDHLGIRGNASCKTDALYSCFSAAIDLRTDPDEREELPLCSTARTSSERSDDKINCVCKDLQRYYGCILKQLVRKTSLKCDVAESDGGRDVADCCGRGVSCSEVTF